jgi:adenosylcobinamide-GDP ribazoletransferase
LLGCGVALVMALIGHFGLLRGVLACAAALAACYGVCNLAKARIGGQTGDVAGCAQILAELAVYLALAIGRAGL